MAKRKMGEKIWLIPDGYLPAESSGKLKSHESTCVLNLGVRPAVIQLVVYFEDRDPMKGFRVVCPPHRTLHIRLDNLKNQKSQAVPTGVPFAVKVESSERIVVQHSRLDTTQPALSLMTTMAFPAR